MRTLLRHTVTGLFFQSPEKWTANADAAYDFRFIERLRQFAQIWELNEAEVAFVFEDTQSISTVPLEKAALQNAA